MGRRNRMQREKDLAAIADRYCRGERQADIAADLGVTQQQVSYDLKELQRRWQTSALANVDAARGRELSKIDNLEREYWAAWLRSCEDAETITQRSRETADGPRKEATKATKDQVGDPRFLQGVQWCIERRCKLLGIDAPEKREIKIENVGLSDSERAAQIIAILEQARAREAGSPADSAESAE